MSTGVRINDKTPLATIDKVLGIKTQGGTAVGPIPFDDFAEQLAASGPMVELIESAAAGNVGPVASWAALAAIAPTRNGQPGYVTNADAGTHTDPVVGGTVNNSGTFSGSLSPLGWRRTGDYIDGAKAVKDAFSVSLWSGSNPIVLEGGKAYCPSLASASSAGSNAGTPASDGIFKQVLTFDGAVQAQTLVYDRSADSFEVINYPAVVTSADKTAVARCYGGRYESLGEAAVLGEVPGGSEPNLMGIDRNSVEAATSVYLGSSQYAADITNADLTALGLKRGYTTVSATKFLYYGCKIPDNSPGKWAFVRVYIQASADNDFGSPRYFFARADEGGGANSLLTLEKKYSARAASYIGWVRMPTTEPYVAIWAGTQTWTGGTAPIICGVQIHYGSGHKQWVMREDYLAGSEAPSQVAAKSALNDAGMDILYTPQMWVVEGRRQMLYPTSLASRRGGRLARRTSLTSLPAVGGVPYVRSIPGAGGVVDPADLTNLATLNISAATETRRRNDRMVLPVTVRKAASNALAGKAVKLLFIGDSLFNYAGVPAATKAKCEAIGATVSMVGTINQTEYDGRYTNVLGEARGGSAWIDWTYAKTNELSPIAPGGEAAYVAASQGTKVTYNPFLRVAVGGDPAPRVKNGYIFDPAFYLSRFSLANPTHVVIGLGTNDLKDDPLSASLPNISESVAIIGAQVRSALPDAPIFFVGNPSAATIGGDSDWDTNRFLGWKKLIEAVALISNSYVLPGWAHVTPDFGWVTANRSTDAVTGQTVDTITDDVHYRNVAMEQMAEMIAAAIANTPPA